MRANRKLVSNLIIKTIDEMVSDEKLGLNTEYTILIRQIISLYYSLYDSSKIDVKDKNKTMSMGREISARADRYMQNIHENVCVNMILDGNNKTDLLNYKCYELVNRYVNMDRIQHIIQNS